MNRQEAYTPVGIVNCGKGYTYNASGVKLLELLQADFTAQVLYSCPEQNNQIVLSKKLTLHNDPNAPVSLCLACTNSCGANMEMTDEPVVLKSAFPPEESMGNIEQ